jgi:hypothetical protein
MLFLLFLLKTPFNKGFTNFIYKYVYSFEIIQNNSLVIIFKNAAQNIFAKA